MYCELSEYCQRQNILNYINIKYTSPVDSGEGTIDIGEVTPLSMRVLSKLARNIYT